MEGNCLNVYFFHSSDRLFAEDLVSRIKDFIADFGHEHIADYSAADAFVALMSDEDEAMIADEIQYYCVNAIGSEVDPHVLILYDEGVDLDSEFRRTLDMAVGDYVQFVPYANEGELFDNLAAFLETI